ncbi:Imm17 family immunity protein [Anaeromicrobium sp.]|jgi:hypothetical protein|uniref:Imm17 family immunity protein n=1 Tax=Anaeromicrobium sp. TaxID=1929132 RepID=UPI003FA47626
MKGVFLIRAISYSDSFLFLIVGLYFLFGAIKKPNWFWNNRKNTRFRNFFGDRHAYAFYIIAGIICIGLGLFRLLQEFIF